MYEHPYEWYAWNLRSEMIFTLYSNQYLTEGGGDSVFRLLCMPLHACSFCCDFLLPTGTKRLPSFAEERRWVRGKETSPVTTPPPSAVANTGGVNPHRRGNSRQFPESTNLLSTGEARMIYSTKDSGTTPRILKPSQFSSSIVKGTIWFQKH